MRLNYSGKWLAWSEDETRILASGDTPEAVRIAVEKAGHARFIYDWVPSATERQTTGLE
jgi:hypothetical protein